MQELIKANADIDLKPGNQFAGQFSWTLSWRQPVTFFRENLNWETLGSILCGFYHQTYRQFLMKPILGPKGGPKFWWDAKEIPLHQKTGISHFFGGYYDWDGTSSKDFSTACCSIAAHFKNQLIRFLAGKTVTYSSIFSWFFIQFLMFWLVKWICQCIFLWFVHWNLVFLTVFWTEGATTVATPQVLREIQELQWRWICNGWVPKTWAIHTWNTYIYIIIITKK